MIGVCKLLITSVSKIIKMIKIFADRLLLLALNRGNKDLHFTVASFLWTLVFVSDIDAFISYLNI